MISLCRTCEFEFQDDGSCPRCHSPLVIAHPELNQFTIAHVDCDAFFASVEKKLNPSLQDKPVIVGFGQRGVVSTACYIARIKGVKSAMPMYKALQLCPEAVVVKPRLNTYTPISKEIKKIMLHLTPSVEFVSIDEAYLDLGGRFSAHKKNPAQLLVKLTKRIESELGLTVSVGLSYNRYLAKIASNLNKPKGFSVIGKSEIETLLPSFSLRVIPGIGKTFLKTLNCQGLYTIADIKALSQEELEERFCSTGARLWHVARGIDFQKQKTSRSIQSISNETTFSVDLSDLAQLEGHAWRLLVKVSDRAKKKKCVGKTVILKLKKTNHTVLTRQMTLHIPTNLASQLFPVVQSLLKKTHEQGPFRLLGVGLKDLIDETTVHHHELLLSPLEKLEIKAELVSDSIRKKYGADALISGRALK